MEFVTMREFVAKPKETQRKLADNRELVVTNNGTPTMLVLDITNRDFMKVVNSLRRQEAADMVRQIRAASVENGTDNMTMEEIDAEIAAYRREKRKKRGE